MFNSEIVIAILSFVLNSILLSGFIIPQVQKLKEVKDQIIKHKITYIPRSGTFSFSEEIKEEALQGEDVADMHKLFDTYRIRTKELSSLVKIFYVSIGLAISAILAIYFFREQRFIILAHAIVQLVVLIWAIKTYAINPEKLQKANYLVREMEIHPHALVSAMGLSLSIYSGKGLLAIESKREDPLKISLSMRLRVFGFRFLYIVAGKDGVIYYISFGPIAAKQLWRHLVPPDKILASGEYNRVELGSFQFNLIEQAQELDITFLVFLPFFKHEKLSPLITKHEFTVTGRDSQSFITGSGGGGEITTMGTFKDIVYRGEGAKIYELKYIGAEDNSLKKVIEKFRNEIIKTTKIRQYSDLKGLQLV